MSAGTGSFSGNKDAGMGAWAVPMTVIQTEMQGQGPSHLLHLPSVSESWEGGFEDWASYFITTTTLIVAVFNRGCPSNTD